MENVFLERRNDQEKFRNKEMKNKKNKKSNTNHKKEI